MTINLTALQKQRRDTAANWTGANPTLLAGEIGIESDTNKIKIGTGSTAWTSLSYTTWSQISAYPIVNADVASAAAIAGTKISPNFGAQSVITTGSGLFGTATSLSTSYSGTGNLQVASNSATTIQTYAFNSTGADYAPGIELARARNTQASPAIVVNGDYMGEINFYGYNTNFQRGAVIYALVDGEPGTAGDTSDMPGKLIFATSANGSVSPTTRLTIDSAGLVTIPGDLTVNGTTTTINSTTLVVQDKNIEMGVVATPTDVTADGGGITLKGTTNKTINWIDSTDAWTFSEHVNIVSAKEYRIAGTKVLDATSLGSAVVGSSLTSVGTISSGTWNGTAIADTYLATISTALKVSNSATTATDVNTPSAIVARNSSGDFTAGTITATLTGNASTVTTNANLTGHVTSVGNAAVLGSFTSAQLATALTDETGSGASVFATSPTLVTPALGTPSSGTLTNCTFPTLNQNTTGNAATVTTNANLTGDVTSVGNATSIAAGVIVDADINASAAIVDTKLATISTAGKVSNSATTATDVNTASAIVARDASGNFTAGTITASLTGTASGNLVSGGALGTPSSGTLTNCTFPTLNQSTTGNAATVTTNANLTGDVTSVGNATSIAAGVIVDADINASAAIVDTKLATIATALKVSNSATTAVSANTASAIVARNSSGDFTAGTITAALTGAASSNVLKAGDTMTGVLAVTAGTAALPAITPSGDPNTGIFSPGADQLAISTNGTQKLIILSDGKTGIGASSPIFLTDILSGTPNTGANVNNPSQLSVTGPNKTLIGGGATFFVNSNSDFAIDNGGSIALSGRNTTSSTNSVVWGVVKGAKENATSTHTAGYLAFASSNHATGALVEAMRIDSQQRVGIGTTSPGAALDIKGNCLILNSTTANSNSIIFQVSNVTKGYIGPAGNLGGSDNDLGYRVESGNNQAFYIGASEKMRLDSSGRLLVGTTTSLSSTSYVQVYKSSGSARSWVQSDSLGHDEAASFTVLSGSRAAELFVYKHNGITNPCGAVSLSQEDGTASYFWADNADQFRTSGNPANIGTTGGTVVGTQTSDERLKNILGPVTYGLDEIKQLDPVSYALKLDPEQVPHLGFIAQQVNPIIPESVFDTKEVIEEGKPTKLGMEYVALIPVLVNAIKDLSAQNEALETRLTALEAA